MRTLLVVLIVAASALFVVAVSIERGNERAHHAEAGEVAPESAEPASAEEEAHTAGADRGEELRPLGIDVEAWPFVAAAALTSLALAIAAWLRPRSDSLLIGVGLVMLGFAVLDIREVFHQADIHETGLAVLAAVIAALHLAAAAVAGRMAITTRAAHTSSTGPTGTMPA
ncbi:MAG TPA: hypothetical protein VFN38_03490 [Gemmatimonadaceae bacterium]|nr:hypothetical protein [Gemmatimonadaceae bacterium]